MNLTFLFEETNEGFTSRNKNLLYEIFHLSMLASSKWLEKDSVTQENKNVIQMMACREMSAIDKTLIWIRISDLKPPSWTLLNSSRRGLQRGTYLVSKSNIAHDLNHLGDSGGMGTALSGCAYTGRQRDEMGAKNHIPLNNLHKGNN